jgi:hypothetical protein
MSIYQTIVGLTSRGEPHGRPLTVLERQFVLAKTTARPDILRFVAPFGRASFVRPTRNGFVVGDGAFAEIQEFDPRGVLVRTVAISTSKDIVRDETAIEMERERLLELYRRKPRGFDEFWSRIEWARIPPTYRSLEVDGADRLWVELYPNATGRKWWVFDGGRKFVGAVAVPTRLEIRAFSGDGVLATVTDDDGVEHWGFYTITPK